MHYCTGEMSRHFKVQGMIICAVYLLSEIAGRIKIDVSLNLYGLYRRFYGIPEQMTKAIYVTSHMFLPNMESRCVDVIVCIRKRVTSLVTDIENRGQLVCHYAES